MSQIPVGVDVSGEGAHPAAWRAADRAPHELFDPARLGARFRAVDDSGLGFLTLPDDTAQQGFPDVEGSGDAVETAVFAAAVTSRVGLVPGANAIHAEPYHLANQLNTLDWSARGRAGWLVRVDGSAEVAAAYGRAPRGEDGAAWREARDVIAAIRVLWDTWEDDIFLADTRTHRFLDLDKWHYADFVGEFFTIRGPGLLPRPPQGQLPIWAEDVDALLAPLIDIAVVSGSAVDTVAARAQEATERGIPRSVAAVEVALDARGERGADRVAGLDRHTVWAPTERLRLVGETNRIADTLVELADLVDGIRLHPAVLDTDLPVIVEELLPALDAAGVLRRPREGQGLRELFELPRPANVFAREKELA